MAMPSLNLFNAYQSISNCRVTNLALSTIFRRQYEIKVFDLYRGPMGFRGVRCKTFFICGIRD